MFDSAGDACGVALLPSGSRGLNRVSCRQCVPSDRTTQTSSPAPSQQTYAMLEPSGAHEGPPRVSSANRLLLLWRRSSGWVNSSNPVLSARTASEARSPSTYASRSPSGDHAGTPATGPLANCLALGSCTPFTNNPSSLPQAIDSRVGDQIGIPAGSPIRSSAPFATRMIKMPDCTSAEVHPASDVAASPRTANSHSAARNRSIPLAIIQAESSGRRRRRLAAGLLFIDSARSESFNCASAGAQEWKMGQFR